MIPLRVAQYGTKHGHAGGKLLALQKNPNVEVVGVFEPDRERQAILAQTEGPFRHVQWFADKEELLSDPSIIAVASEGLNADSLEYTEEIVQAGKHVWYDKPAGDNWEQWKRVIALAEERRLIVQMGYMFRYHHGFSQIAEWARSGFLGEIFSIRAHMSTDLTEDQRRVISVHPGGILYDLGGHMLDQVVWILGRPTQVTAFLRNDSGVVPAFSDNTVAVFEFGSSLAFIDIAAMETRPMARRYEVYGSKGSAIIVDPFEPAKSIRLCLEEGQGDYAAGEQIISLPSRSRQDMYERELEVFVDTVTGKRAPGAPGRGHCHTNYWCRKRFCGRRAGSDSGWVTVRFNIGEVPALTSLPHGFASAALVGT